MEKTMSSSRAKTIAFSVLAALFVVICAFSFAACGGPDTIYQSDFSDKSRNDFNVYTENNSASGLTINTEDKTATITANSSNQGSNTYFGNNKTKNTEVDYNSAVVSVKVKVDSATMENGEGFIWSVALNKKLAEEADTYTQATETFIYVGKDTDGKVKVYQLESYSSIDSLQQAIANEDAVELANGWYEIRYAYKVAENDVVKLDISVVNEDGDTVYESKDATTLKKTSVADGESEYYTVDELAGLRYGWFSLVTADNVVVSSVTVTQ